MTINDWGQAQSRPWFHSFVREDKTVEGYLTVQGHEDDRYNGRYFAGEEWGGRPHFVNEQGSHFYYIDVDDDGSGYWQLDDRDQDGTNDWYSGGYYWCSSGHEELLERFTDETTSIDTEFSSGHLVLSAYAHTDLEYVVISGHSDAHYNGYYYRGEDWGGLPHFLKRDRAAHLFYFDGYW